MFQLFVQLGLVRLLFYFIVAMNRFFTSRLFQSSSFFAYTNNIIVLNVFHYLDSIC